MSEKEQGCTLKACCWGYPALRPENGQNKADVYGPFAKVSKGVALNATKTTGEVFLYVTASMAGNKSYSDFCEVRGVEVSQVAKDPITAKNITVQMPNLNCLPSCRRLQTP